MLYTSVAYASSIKVSAAATFNTSHIINLLNAHVGLLSSDPEPISDCLHCHGKCLFCTGDGLIGLCPSGAEIEDIVVVLYGARIPRC